MPASPCPRGPALLPGVAALVALAAPLGAQGAPAAAVSPPAAAHRSQPADRWTVAAHYLHVGAAPIRRRAEPSMAVTIARTIGGSAADERRGARVEAGWLRASRVATQAQGVTLGMSYGVPVGGPLVRRRVERPNDGRPALGLRPGVAVLVGWAEAQTWETWYHWRGLPGTAEDGQTGAARAGVPVRGRTTGAGASLAADVRLSRGVALTGSVQRWTFSGAVIRPNRWATLAGVGLSVRPRTVASDTRAWWRSATAQAPATDPSQTAAQAAEAP